jgi:hypothetical protein
LDRWPAVELVTLLLPPPPHPAVKVSKANPRTKNSCLFMDTLLPDLLFNQFLTSFSILVKNPIF